MKADTDDEPQNTSTVKTMVVSQTSVQKFKDAFEISGDDIKELNGQSAAMKKRVTRRLNKAASVTMLANPASESKAITDEITGYDVFQVVIPPHQLEYLAELYDLSSYYHGAVDALVANTVSLGYHFEASNQMKYQLEVTDDAGKTEKMRQKLSRNRARLEDWLDTLNDADALQDILEKVMTDYFTMGNGYIEVARTVEGDIQYIGHVPAATIRVRRARDGFVQIIGKDAVFFRNFGDTETTDPIGGDSQPNELIHFKNYTPKNTYYGVPDIYSAKNAIAGNQYSSDFNLDYFENKAVPRYIITLKNAVLDAAGERRLLEFFEVGLKGQGNNHRSLYVPLIASNPDEQPELKFEAIESGQIDSSFNEYRKANRDEILMALRVPINKLGLATGVSLAAGRDASKGFKEEVCQPVQRRVEKKFGSIILEQTDTLVFKLDQLTLTDEDTQSRVDERLVRIQAVTPNEIRDRMGLPSVSWGDQPVVLTAQGRAEQNTQTSGNRTRDQQRQATAPDTTGEARNAQGDGRAAN